MFPILYALDRVVGRIRKIGIRLCANGHELEATRRWGELPGLLTWHSNLIAFTLGRFLFGKTFQI